MPIKGLQAPAVPETRPSVHTQTKTKKNRLPVPTRGNLCLASMLETVRASAGPTIDIDVVNRVLLQPHWQNEVDLTDF